MKTMHWRAEYRTPNLFPGSVPEAFRFTIAVVTVEKKIIFYPVAAAFAQSYGC